MASIQKIIPTVLLILGLCCPGPSFGQGKEKAKAPETITELQTAIEKVLKQTATPAAGLALVAADSIVWVAGLGKANREKDIDATAHTMFRIGSTSKMFVSLAILKLQEEGLVSLKDKVRDLVPEIEFKNPWSKTAPVLVEHLLEHTTGWDDIHLTEYALNDPALSLKQGLDFHPHSRTSRWMPGTRMAYCNSGPPVAAYIVEKITGQKFEDYVEEHFFQPMGMESMTFFASEAYKQLGAALYLDKIPQKYWNISMRPSGAINASPNDMARMLKFFINRGRTDSLQLIGEASLIRMETPSSSTGAQAGLEYGYGLSNYSSPHKSFVYRSHNGGMQGGLTDFSYLPDHQVGYAVMINSSNGDALHRISDLIRNFQTRHLPADASGKGKVVHKLQKDISGYYVPINPRTQMSHHVARIMHIKQIWTNNDFIFTQNLLGGPLETHVPLNDHQYTALQTGKISLVQVKDPIAGEVVHAGSQVLLRISPLLVYGQLLIGAVWIFYLLGSVFFGGIVLILYWRGKITGRKKMGMGLWPFLASLLFLAVFLLPLIGGDNPLEMLGRISFVSVATMILSISFALASLWSVLNLIKERKADINKYVYWHLVILSGLHFLVTCYLLWHGVIGIRTWT